MSTKVKPVPEGVHTLQAYLCLKDAARALDFYKQAFGATETMARITDKSGKIGHAEIRIGDSVLMIADEFPEHRFRSPQSLGGCPVLFVLNVEDVDAAVERAVAAGAKLTRPVADQLYGDRTGEIEDDFGYRWHVSTHVEDVSEEEMQKRAAERGDS
jgi:PhnB protein